MEGMMKITDEMVEAGCKARYVRWRDFQEDHRPNARKKMFSILTAALSASPAGVVKPMEWEYHERSVATYVSKDDRGDLYWINQSFGSDSYYFTTIRQSDGATLYDADDLEAAKSAAFADYSARIMSAIEPAGVGVETEAVYVIPRDMTDEEWAEVKYNVDRKADPDIPLWRIKEAVNYADFIAGHRGRAALKGDEQ